MNFREAIEEGYLIVVADGTLARVLSRIYKNGKFASINSDQSRFDGYRGIFIDQYISANKRVSEIKDHHHNVFVGPLYSDIKPAKYTIEIDNPEDPPRIFVDGEEIKHLIGLDLCYETRTDSKTGCHNLNLIYPSTEHSHVKTDGFTLGEKSGSRVSCLPPSVTLNLDSEKILDAVSKSIEKIEQAKRRRMGI